jgi:hypothetical protein
MAIILSQDCDRTMSDLASPSAFTPSVQSLPEVYELIAAIGATSARSPRTIPLSTRRRWSVNTNCTAQSCPASVSSEGAGS